MGIFVYLVILLSYLKLTSIQIYKKESNNSFTEMYLQIFKIQTQKPSIPSIKIY